MYVLLGRIQKGLDSLRKQFEVLVREDGDTAVSLFVDGIHSESEGKPDRSGESEDFLESLDTKLYFETLLAVYHKYAQTLEKSFNNDSRFAEILERACLSFFNHNAVVTDSFKAAQLLVKYADKYLRKGKVSASVMDEEDVESALDRVVCLVVTSFCSQYTD
jgi:hypothetical protein